MPIISVCNEGAFVRITVPYHPEMVKEFRALDAKFDNESKSWLLDLRNIELARNAMHKIFGRDDAEVELTSLKVLIKTLSYYSIQLSPLTMFGRVLVTARNGKAMTGDYVLFPSAQPTIKGENIVFPAGTEILLHDIPRSFAESEKDYVCQRYKCSVAFLQTNPPLGIVELMKEKERLIVRLREIDSLLGQALIKKKTEAISNQKS